MSQNTTPDPAAGAKAPDGTTIPTTPEGRATTFQPVEGGPEQHSGATLLVEAYVVLWLLLMGWLLLVWRRQKTVNGRLDDLERAIDRAAARLEKK